MSKFFGGFFNRTPSSTEEDFKNPYLLDYKKEEFSKVKIELLYRKILHRCYSRSEGAKDEEKISSLFDSSEKSGSPRGLITLLSKAMAEKKEIAIIYESGVVRLANATERSLIKKDYIDGASSKLGVLLSFTDYCLTDLVSCYMSMIYDILSSMNTQVGLAKALQIKINTLRGTVSVNGKEEPIKQAKEINEALTNGKSVLMDKNDQVETLILDSDSVKNALNLVNSLLASDLGVSLSFVNGELTSGMSATGEADQNADEYGFQDFFNSIFKPTCDNLYGWNLKFVSDDWRYFSSMINSLIIVENSMLLSQEQKQAFANRLMPVDK
jgi:hypothetical protein